MGPEGGEGGGLIVAQGPPELVAHNAASHTGGFLARYYNGSGTMVPSHKLPPIDLPDLEKKAPNRSSSNPNQKRASLPPPSSNPNPTVPSRKQRKSPPGSRSSQPLALAFSILYPLSSTLCVLTAL